MSRTSLDTMRTKRVDLFVKSWVQDMPVTTTDKAVWEFDRDDEVFRPFKWDGMTLNPNIPYHEIDGLFARIRQVEAVHFDDTILTYLTTAFLASSASVLPVARP